MHEKEVIQSDKKFLEIVAVIALIILLGLYFLTPLKDWFTTPERIRQTVLSAGALGPLLLILLQIIQSVFSVFIPGQFISVAGGYVFGWFYGTLLNLTGTLIGAMIVFKLSRKFGRGFVERYVPQRELNHINAFVSKRGFLAVLIARCIPVFPNDAVSLCVGLTKMDFKKYAIGSALGFIPHMLIWNILGSQLYEGVFNVLTIAIILLATILGAIYFFRHELKILLIKEIRELENDAIKLERKAGLRKRKSHLRIIVSPKARTG